MFRRSSNSPVWGTHRECPHDVQSEYAGGGSYATRHVDARRGSLRAYRNKRKRSITRPISRIKMQSNRLSILHDNLFRDSNIEQSVGFPHIKNLDPKSRTVHAFSIGESESKGMEWTLDHRFVHNEVPLRPRSALVWATSIHRPETGLGPVNHDRLITDLHAQRKLEVTNWYR